jgi:gluconate 2-dehydrogenase gamma chain
VRHAFLSLKRHLRRRRLPHLMPRPRRRPKPFSRRIFIQRLTFLGGGVVLLGSACTKDTEPTPKPAKPKPPGIPRLNLTTSHKTFTDEEFKAVEAACERVIPKDEDPGALDANVPHYIDHILQSPELHKMKEDFLGGIDALMRRSRRMFKKDFWEATAEQQDDLLRIFRDSPPESGEAHLYESLIVLTLEGLLGDPSYGGNKDRVGWALVGFGTSEPPVGHDGMQALHHHDHGER